MSTEIVLHPEVEEILREVAATPGSRLLRVPRHSVERTVMERGATARARATELSAAERHLVMAHREQLAFVLRQAAYAKLNDHESTRLYVIDRADPRLAPTVPTRRNVSVAASEALRNDLGQGEAREAPELLERCVAPDHGAWASVSQLAAASHRLVPTDAARIYCGLDLIAGRQLPAAARLLREVADRPGSRLTAAAANCDIALVLRLQGRVEEAADSSFLGARLDRRNLMAQLNGLWSALEVGSRGRALECAENIEGILTANESRLDLLEAWLPNRRSRLGLNPIVAAASLDIRDLAARGPILGGLIHAVC